MPMPATQQLWSSSQLPVSRMPSLEPYQQSQAAAPLHVTPSLPLSRTEVVFGVPLGEPVNSGPGRPLRQPTTRRNTPGRQGHSAEFRPRLRNLVLKPTVILMPLDVSPPLPLFFQNSKPAHTQILQSLKIDRPKRCLWRWLRLTGTSTHAYWRTSCTRYRILGATGPLKTGNSDMLDLPG